MLHAKALFEELEQQIPDLIILDIMLAETSMALIFVKHYKKILLITVFLLFFLSAKNEEFDKVLGLELGAEDYITKPFFDQRISNKSKSCVKKKS